MRFLTSSYAPLALIFVFGLCLSGCADQEVPQNPETIEAPTADDFVWSPEKFADKRMIRYQIPGFEKLTLPQKKLVYYLSEAGLAGRDIMYDQNYRHNLEIRRALDRIVKDYQGDKNSEDWTNFMVYTKNVWFSGGIHHHYSMDKFEPAFSEEYFQSLLSAVGHELSGEASKAIFDPAFDAKKVNLDPAKGLVKGSAVNFYDPDISEAEVDEFYSKMIDKDNPTPISYGLNSKLVPERRRQPGRKGLESRRPLWKRH